MHGGYKIKDTKFVGRNMQCVCVCLFSSKKYYNVMCKMLHGRRIIAYMEPVIEVLSERIVYNSTVCYYTAIPHPFFTELS